MINRSMGGLEWGQLVLLSILWGGSFFFNEIAVRELPPLSVVVGRVVLAALILLVVLRLLGQQMPTSRSAWAAFFGMGFLNNVIPFTLIVWGQVHIASGVASILNATTPLFTAIVAHWMTADEKLNPGRLLGVIAGLAGVTVIIGGEALASLAVDVVAHFAILGAALSYGFAGVFGRRFRAMGIPPMTTAAGQVTASSVMLIPVMLVVDQPWLLPAPSLSAIGAVLGVAALSTALAYILFFRILATAGATNLSLVTFLIPISAVLLGVLLLGEVLLPRHLIGMAFIACGLAVIDGRPWQFLRAALPAKPAGGGDRT